MKHLSLLLTAACVLGTAGGAGSQVADHPGTNGQPPRQVRHVQRPPDSVAVHGRARQSTAQAAAVRANKPPLEALPAFSVTDLNGKLATTKELVRRGHWLLVYQRQHCPPCDSVLSALAASPSPMHKRGLPYVIIVAAPTADALARVRAGYPALSDATWMADSNRAAFTALKLTSAPMLYGMHGGKIAFRVPGSLGSPETVEKLASSWLAKKEEAGSSAGAVAAPAAAQ